MEKGIISISLVVAGVLVMLFAYELIFIVAPLKLDFADAFDELVTNWEAVGSPEEAAECREYASQLRGWSRTETMITGFFIGAVGITFTGLGVGLGVVHLANFRKSRR